MSSQAVAIFVYDITAWNDRISKENLQEWCITHCKKWCFQLEKAPTTGTLHFQCRVSFKEKLRPIPVQIMVQEWGHSSPTSNENKTNEFYVMKTESRIEGPWSNKDEVLFVQNRFRGVIRWLPWQQDIINKNIERPDDRSVNLIINKSGNKGKTFLAMWCLTNRVGRMIPPLNDYKEVVQAVMDMPTSRAYFLDVPRSQEKKQLRGFFGACEQIKNGHVFDCRYSFKEKLFEPPHLWVFTNEMPELSTLSRDRWKFWTINDDNELVRFKADDDFNEDEESDVIKMHFDKHPGSDLKNDDVVQVPIKKIKKIKDDITEVIISGTGKNPESARTPEPQMPDLSLKKIKKLKKDK